MSADAPRPSPRDPEENLAKLVAIEARDDGRLVSTPLGGNQNGRVFGGQLLAQAMSAAAHGIEGRAATSMQFQFLQGALVGEPMDFRVETLQQGKRFVMRHVRATQGPRQIAAATVSFQVEQPGLDHAIAMPADVPAPDDVPTLDDLDAHIAGISGPYQLQQKRSLDLRIVGALDLLYRPAAEPRLRYWVKARHALADVPHLHAAALAYLSDSWLSYGALAVHVPLVGSREQIYAASLNHTMWLHAPARADQWLLFDVAGPRARGGRALSQAHVFDRRGMLVATVAQELAVSPREP